MKSGFVHTGAQTQPKDKSIEAYKAWIGQIAIKLTTGATPISLTEQEWHQSWREYWSLRQQPKSMPKT